MIEFGFFFSRETTEVTEQRLSRIGLPMVRMEMPNRETVSVAARVADFDQQSIPELRNLRIPVAAAPQAMKGGGLENVSAVLMNEPSENTPLVLISIQGFNLVRDGSA